MKMQESLDANPVKPSDPRLYTVADLRRRFAAFQRATTIVLAGFIALLFAFFAAIGVIFPFVLPEPLEASAMDRKYAVDLPVKPAASPRQLLASRQSTVPIPRAESPLLGWRWDRWILPRA